MEQYDVFISYSHADTQTMTHVRDHLRTLGMRIWTDEGIVPGTQNWQIAIEQALRNTRAVVVLLSLNHLSPCGFERNWDLRKILEKKSIHY